MVNKDNIVEGYVSKYLYLGSFWEFVLFKFEYYNL